MISYYFLGLYKPETVGYYFLHSLAFNFLLQIFLSRQVLFYYFFKKHIFFVKNYAFKENFELNQFPYDLFRCTHAKQLILFHNLNLCSILLTI